MINEKRQFILEWKTSSAVQLLIPDPNISLELGKESGFQASIAFLAFKRGLLDRLNCLIDKWEIKTKGTKAFKGRLNENWLEENEEKRRKAANDTLSALSELIVAKYLEDIGFKIIDMGAWNDKSVDVVCKRNDKDFYFEVKLFPDSPEFEKLRINSFKNNRVLSKSMSPSPETLNYYYSRLAEAVLQLKKISNEFINVFFVFTESAGKLQGRTLFEDSIGKRIEWYRDPTGDYPNVLGKNRDIILNKTPVQWFNEISELYLTTMKNYELQNIKKYNLVAQST